MDRQNTKGDMCMNGGVTLRSLLQSRDLLSLPVPAKVADKEDIDSCDVPSDATAAFLGPNIWDKTLSDFKLEYFDIDDILEKIIPSEAGPKVVEGDENIKPEGSPQLLQLTSAKESKNLHVTIVPEHTHAKVSLPPLPQKGVCKSPPPSPSPEEQPSLHGQESKKIKFTVELPFSPSELALATAPGHEDFDPTRSSLPEEDLKPQPMVKKSQKNFVPEGLKDAKYWARRRKNNIAAKRSREARRVKENQIVLRASFLEKENGTLKDDVRRLKAENEMLRNQLKQYKQ